MIPAHVFAGAEDWCRECDDQYLEYDGPPLVEKSCAERGHHRLFDPALLRWHICDICKGEGTLRGYPGVYTSDDFAEDPDLADDYMAHTRPCEECSGRGSVKGVDESILDGEFPELADWVNDYYDSEAISAQERRMGA